jgi:nicotinate-nucleotide adenylyltransferase
MVEQVLLHELPDGRQVDQVWLLPVGHHSFAKDFVSAKHRLAMLTLLKSSLVRQYGPTWEDKIALEDYEIRQTTESQTYATLTFLAKKYPEHDFSFLIGSDNLAQFHLWHHYQEMLQQHPFYVYPRTGYPLQPLYEGMIPLQGFIESSVSSTAVREALLEGKDNQSLLDSSISNYIQKEGLFQKA